MTDFILQKVSESPLVIQTLAWGAVKGILKDLEETDCVANAEGTLVLLNYPHSYTEYLLYRGPTPFKQLDPSVRVYFKEARGLTQGAFSCTKVNPNSFPMYDCSRAYRLYLDGVVVGYFQNGRTLQHLVDLRTA